MEILEKSKQNFAQTNRKIMGQTAALISSAFAFVAALAWNEAIKGIIDLYFPAQSGIASRLLYAVLVTVIAVIITTRLNNIAEKYKD